MNNVIELPLKTKKFYKVEQHGPRFVCMKCDGEIFVLFADGKVLCEMCHSKMRNLWVYHCPEKA